jgi:hypothetical protein
MKFAADAMLGKLARWLRILGCDVSYNPSVSLKELVESANRDERIFLTRRKSFPHGVEPITLFNVLSEYFPEQLRRVIRHFDLDTNGRLFTRCLDCNTEVIRVEKSQIKNRVPEKSWEGFNEFFECPSCQTIYWGGAHRRNTLNRLRRILQSDQ